MTQRSPVHILSPDGTPGQIPTIDAAGTAVEWGDAAAGGVQSVVAGTGITVDSTDPANPIVSAPSGGGGGDTAWHFVGAAGEPAFENSFSNYGSGYSSCAFRKLSSGLVVVKGLVKRASTGAISNLSVFTLPAGYRPAENFLIPTYCEPSPVVVPRLDVFSTGVVRISIGTSGWTSLDTIRFYAG